MPSISLGQLALELLLSVDLLSWLFKVVVEVAALLGTCSLVCEACRARLVV